MSISALKEKFNSLTLESENHWDYRGNNNSERDYVHGFCTYPAMMVPKMQREMLDVCLEHLQDTSIRLLDPFAGSGTILVEGIFKIGSSYFLLVSQACDTCLRSDGHRKLEFASLLEIQDNKQTKFSYPLSCFLDMQKPVVMYHALKIIPFDILDLCVFNGSGQASVVLNDIASFDSDLEAYTNNYRIRFGEVLETVKAVQSNRAKLESFLSGGADITAEDAKAAYEYLEGVDSNMKKFDSIEIAISFPVRRIARLNELTTIDIVKEYGIALSRIGHPFDFSGEISAFE